MSVSIYYSATRNSPITSTENINLQSIIERFNEGFPYKNEAETLSFYREPLDEYVLEGSTKLPLYDENMIIESANYWLEALTQLTSVLPTAHWDVSIDHFPASWVDDHWEM